MRRILASLIAILGLVSGIALAQTTPLQADKFVDSIGVNTHYGNLGTNWQIYYPQLVQATAAMGIRHTRDGLNLFPSSLAAHNMECGLGIGTLYQLPNQGATSWTGYAACDGEAWEGPDEQNIITSGVVDPALAASYASFLATAPSLVPPSWTQVAPSFPGPESGAFLQGGFGYTQTATVTIVPQGSGSGGTCTATMGTSTYGGKKVSSISCSGGTGYSTAPKLLIQLGSGDSTGFGASATVTVSGGALGTATVQNLSAGSFTVNNAHCYQAGFIPESTGWGGSNYFGHQYGSMQWCIDGNTSNAPSAPLWVTEGGYNTEYPVINGLPESSLAAYVSRWFLNNYSLGIQRTYIYDLMDDGLQTQAGIATDLAAGFGGQNQQYAFGLLHNDLSWKPSAFAIQSMTHLLADPGVAFTPTSLTYTVTGGTNVNKLLLEKRDGTYYVAMWIAQSNFAVNNYPFTTSGFTPVTPQTVTLTVSGSPQLRNLYQMDAGGGLQQAALSGQTTSIYLTDRPTFVQIK